jgi:hypothetical protein
MFSIVVYGVVGCTSIWAHLGSGMFWVCFRCKVLMLRMILVTMKLCRVEVIVN